MRFIKLLVKLGTLLIPVLALGWNIQLSSAQTCNDEVEPNNSLKSAQIMADCNTGQFSKDDRNDHFKFSLSEEQAIQKFDFEVETNAEKALRLCLKTQANINLQCRSGLGLIALTDLRLAPGDYALELYTITDSAKQYTLSKTITDSSLAEVEPNDTYQTATPYGESSSVSGRFVGKEWDVYTITVEGAPQLWRVQAIGNGVTDLRYLDAAGNALQSTVNQGARRTRLPHLMLTAGNHHIALRGTDS